MASSSASFGFPVPTDHSRPGEQNDSREPLFYSNSLSSTEQPGMNSSFLPFEQHAFEHGQPSTAEGLRTI